MRGEILESWNRCVTAGVDPYDIGFHEYLVGSSLKKSLIENKALIEVSEPFMKDLYNLVKGTGFVVVLTNSKGNILQMFSDYEDINTPNPNNFFIGSNWSEAVAGTNAIGTALKESKPVQVTGPEHFCRKHHRLTCSSAPVFDSSGTLIGVLDISGAYESAHSHTLGMVIAAAKAINAQIKITNKNHELVVANNKLVSFFNMVSDGVLMLDQYGMISELNPAAEHLFAMNRSELLGHLLQSLIQIETGDANLRNLVTSNRSYTEIEVALKTARGPYKCYTSIEPIRNGKKAVTGILVTLKPVKAVQKFVHRYSGYSASLQFRDIIGVSTEIRETITLAKLSAQNDSNVLLQGESGTGKEIFAQAIHNSSRRSNAPFIPLNCGAIPRDLVGSELFGYEDGAFTGSRKGGKPGKFELASGGTLFLDEIGDMPLEQQAMLLRVIQEKRMMRIGGIKVIPVDVRLICATHKNLLEKVRNGTFRQDLYYRLNVMSITIPPLSERKADIPQLFRHFIEKLSKDRGARLKVDENILHFLYAYSWPGNVRELQNVAERAANLAINGVVSVNQLPSEITHPALPVFPERSETTIQVQTKYQRRSVRQEREKRQLVQLLDVYEGNVSRVARELGVSRKTVYNRMHRHAIAN